MGQSADVDLTSFEARGKDTCLALTDFTLTLICVFCGRQDRIRSGSLCRFDAEGVASSDGKP